MEKEDIWLSPNEIAYVSSDLIKAIRSFPTSVEATHCNIKFFVSPFDIYGICPQCEVKIKLRSFTSSYELPDVFDSVFEWLLKPEAKKLLKERQKIIIEATNEED